jgi:putative transposase
VDALGFVLGVSVQAADVQDRDGAMVLLKSVEERCPWLRQIWADAGYVGRLVDWAMTTRGWALEIVKRTDHRPGFRVLPRRWVIERTFAWLGRYRRLSKDYEYRTETSEAMIYAAMARRLARWWGLSTPFRWIGEGRTAGQPR